MSDPLRLYRFDVDGDTFVQHSDYAALRARFDALVGEVRSIKARLLSCGKRDMAAWCDAAIENAEKAERGKG